MKITIEIDTETRTATVTDDHEQKRTSYQVAAFEWRNEFHDINTSNGYVLNVPTGRSWVKIALDNI